MVSQVVLRRLDQGLGSVLEGTQSNSPSLRLSDPRYQSRESELFLLCAIDLHLLVIVCGHRRMSSWYSI